jgi:deazaflavin-dependent oxidoreductase (nitroreductase family)
MARSTGKVLQKAISRLHAGLYGLSGGRIGGRFGKAPILLLETTGRKSGKRRTTPLMYVSDGESLVLVASNGGAPNHPAWYLNLQANPEAAAQVRSERRQLRARDATTEERERYWPQLAAIWPSYEDYQRKTTRKIPLVVLEPR